MNLFDVYPQFSHEEAAVLKGRSLRLIALSAIIYDETAFYFEINEARMWGRLSAGRFAVGVGALKVQPDPHNLPVRVLSRYLRDEWRCETALFSTGKTYIVDEHSQVTWLEPVESVAPYLLILTPPRLGGGDEVPDALAQAVYMMSLHRWRSSSQRARLLKIQRAALGDFLAPSEWDLTHLKAQPWVEFLGDGLPEDAIVRPVLALRGLQTLLRVDGVLF